MNEGPHEPIEFVERPGRFSYRNNNRMAALEETARNGKAILAKESTVAGGYRTALWERGYRLHKSSKDAPKGLVYCWCTAVEDESETS